MKSKYMLRFSAVVLSGLFIVVGYAQSGAVAFDPSVPPFHNVKPSTTGIPGEEVRLMKLDPSGNLWVFARFYFWQEYGLAMLSADQLQHDPLPGGGFDTGAWRVWSSINNPIPTQYTYDMEFTSDGTMWLASEGGLTRFRPNAPDPADRWFTYTPSNSPLVLSGVRSIAIDSAENIWISNAIQNYAFSYLFKLNTATGEWTPISTGQQPWEVAVGNNGHVFISMLNTGGITEFNGTSWVHHAASPRELSSIMQDSQGNVWAAGSAIDGDGLWRWNGSTWQNWPQVGGTITVTGIGTDRDGVVYVSTWYGGIYKMINDTPVFFVDAQHLPRSVIALPNGDIYVNNYGSTAQLGTVRHYTAAGQLLERINTYNSGLPDYFIDRIRRDSQGNMWFASLEGGLTRMFGSDGSVTAPTHWRNFGSHNVQSEPYPWGSNEGMRSFFEDTGGIIWMGGQGVGRWDSNTGQFTNFWNYQNSTLDSSGHTDITKRSGTMWVGSGGNGVYWLNAATQQWTHVSLSPEEFNFAYNNVRAMAVDTESNLWVASEFGLRKFAPGNNSTFTFYHDGNSPLPSGNLVDVAADPSGGIWVGTYQGLARFDGTNWAIYTQANTGMPGNVVGDVSVRPSDGLIAIANKQGTTFPYTGGVSTFDGKTWTHYTTENSPLTHWQVEAVEFDANGNLWASPLSTGVVQIMIGKESATRHPPFDFDGDGRTDVSVFRPSDGNWHIDRSTAGYLNAVWGAGTDRLATADYDGDLKTDIAVFRPSTGTWYILNSSTGTYTQAVWGNSADITAPGDFDDDGRADIAVFRPSDGNWHISGSTAGYINAVWGASGDVPVQGDYDADGKTDIAVYRPSNGTWYINRSTAGFYSVTWGNSTDRVVNADYDGDGRDDIAVWRPSDGNWHILRSTDRGYTNAVWGASGDVPVPGDYDGDNKADIAAIHDGTWHINQSSSGYKAVLWGVTTDVAVPGRY